MSFSDLDKQEKDIRRQEQIEWRTKKSASNLFLFCTVVVNVLLSIGLIALLFYVASLLMFRFMDNEGQAIQTLFPIVMIVILAGSLVLSFILHKKLARLAIKKFKLGDKLLDEVLNHFKTKNQSLDEYKQELLK